MSDSPEEAKQASIERGQNAIKGGLENSDLCDAYNLYDVMNAISNKAAFLSLNEQAYLANQMILLINELAEKNITNLQHLILPNQQIGRPSNIRQRIFRVGNLIAKKGFSRNKAYMQIASEDGVNPTTIRTQYLSYEKKHKERFGKGLPK